MDIKLEEVVVVGIRSGATECGPDGGGVVVLVFEVVLLMNVVLLVVEMVSWYSKWCC